MSEFTLDQTEALATRQVMRRWFIWVDALDPIGDPAPAGFWDDVGNVEIDGRTYYGSGTVITIGELQAVSDLSIPGLRITVSNIETTSANLVRGNTLAQRSIIVSLGIYDVAARALIPPLVPRFVGVIDDIEIITPAAGDRSSIELICESAARAMTIRRTDTRSPASCQERAATDRFYDYTAGQAERVIYFGRAGGSSAGAAVRNKGSNR